MVVNDFVDVFHFGYVTSPSYINIYFVQMKSFVCFIFCSKQLTLSSLLAVVQVE